MNSELEKNEDYRYSTWIVGGNYKLPILNDLTFNHQGTFTVIRGASEAFKEIILQVPNQVQWVVDHFKQKGLGNEHCYVQVGYPESNFAYDVPYNNPNERRTSPCLRGLDFRVIDGYLTTHVIYRSWDLVSGWPTNMGGFALLNEYIASEIEVKPGPLSFSCKSLHAYDHCYEYLKNRLRK
jgi:hypothetical protein